MLVKTGQGSPLTAESGYQQKACSFPLFRYPVVFLFVRMMNFLDEKKVLFFFIVIFFRTNLLVQTRFRE